jgi:oxygen-independent coproporphyrinogen III oxidase
MDNNFSKVEKEGTLYATQAGVGLYLHIPFCKQACHYCNFHFSTSLQHRSSMTPAIVRELQLQRNYLEGRPLQSIYFGGGTPSILPMEDLVAIFEAINAYFEVLLGAEITLEANPDDLSLDYLHSLRTHTPVNRLSIGIQSFSDDDLRWMNRAHSAKHARACLENAIQAHFDNLTADLIYGAPTTSHTQWAENVRILMEEYRLPHISCYNMTVEPGTALHKQVAKGKSANVDEENAAQQMEYLMQQSAALGYEQYEISNFALPGRYAVHNTNYWRGVPYLGIGPSAHAYNGRERQWNVANNAHYLKAIEDGKIPAEVETLSDNQRYNEYVMTMLRTQWGCEQRTLDQLLVNGSLIFQQQAATFLDSGHLIKTATGWQLSRAGRLLADKIAMELFVVNKG